MIGVGVDCRAVVEVGTRAEPCIPAVAEAWDIAALRDI